MATNQQNNLNKGLRVDNLTGVKGVNRHPKSDKFCVRIQHEGVRAYLGLYASLQEAALVYNEAAIKYHGEFAKLNDLDQIKEQQ
jgi:hypothetical protein